MRSIEEIYEDMKQTYEERCSVVLNDSGEMALRIYTVAAQIFAMETQAEFVKNQAFPQYAEGEYLDLHATIRGLARTGETHAVGEIRFYVSATSTTAIEIPQGTVCTDVSGTEFETTELGTISAGSLYCSVAAQAKLGGENGNVPAGEITYMLLAPTGVSACNNISAFVGGSVSETDESLRARIIASYNALPNGANIAYYEQQALSIDGVYAVQVLPKVRGAGTVDIVIASSDGVPSSDVIAKVQELIEEQREICVDISVYAPTTKATAIKINLLCDTSLYDTVEEKITEYFSGALLGKAVLLADIANVVYSIDGVSNYEIITPSADVAATDGVLPILSTITLGAMG